MTKSHSKNKSRKENRNTRWTVCRELKATVFPVMGDVHKIFSMTESKRKRGEQELLTVIVPYDTNIAADSSGNVQAVFSNDPNNSTYWVDYRSNFDSYRVLGMRVSFQAFTLTGGSSVTTRSPIAVITDYDDPTVLTGYALAETFSDHARYRAEQTWTKVACESATEVSWNTTMASPPTNGMYVKLYSAGNSASLSLGRVKVEYLVQLRARGI